MRITTELINKYPVKNRRILIGLKKFFPDNEDITYPKLLLYLMEKYHPHEIENAIIFFRNINKEWNQRLIGIITYNYLPSVKDVAIFFKNNCYNFSAFVYSCISLYSENAELVSVKMKDVFCPFVYAKMQFPKWIDMLIQELHKQMVLYGKKDDDFLFHDGNQEQYVRHCNAIRLYKMKEYFGINYTEYLYAYPLLINTIGVCFYRNNLIMSDRNRRIKNHYMEVLYKNTKYIGNIFFDNFTSPIIQTKIGKFAVSMDYINNNQFVSAMD